MQFWCRGNIVKNWITWPPADSELITGARRLVASANSFFPFKNKWREIKIFFLNGLCREIQRRTQRLLILDMLAWLTRGDPPVVYNRINWSPLVTFYEDDMLPVYDYHNLFSLRNICKASSWESMWGVGIQGSKILLMKTHTRRSLLNTNNPTVLVLLPNFFPTFPYNNRALTAQIPL